MLLKREVKKDCLKIASHRQPENEKDKTTYLL